ncbi:MAG TPA: hypothetical protein VNP04_25305 [Alphaproteobacteria bacterium]|nr:hypothetical protein [Alphaproteobacteria bacterium]
MRTFKGVAATAGQPQILFNCCAAGGLGEEMIEFHGHAEQRFAAEAIATAVLGLCRTRRTMAAGTPRRPAGVMGAARRAC